jgi:hypothetical protein
MSVPNDVKELVLARLQTFPSDKKLCIGSYGEFSKEDLIECVKKGDEIGKKIIDIELGFLRAMKEGIL